MRNIIILGLLLNLSFVVNAQIDLTKEEFKVVFGVKNRREETWKVSKGLKELNEKCYNNNSPNLAKIKEYIDNQINFNYESVSLAQLEHIVNETEDVPTSESYSNLRNKLIEIKEKNKASIISNATNTTTPTSPDNTISQQVNSENQNNGFTWIELVICFLLGLGIGIAVVYFIFYKPQIKNLADKEELENKIRLLESNLREYESSKKEATRQMQNLANNKNDLEREKESYLKEIERLKRNIQEKDTKATYNIPQAELSIDLKSTKFVEEFYISVPEGENLFNNNYRRSFNETGSTFYKFYVSPNRQEAEFEFIDNNEALSYARGEAQTYITPVCEPTNALTDSARRVNTIERGKAKLQGSNWIVTRKAKIRYE